MSVSTSFSHRVVLWGVVKYFALRAIHEILGKTPCYNFFYHFSYRYRHSNSRYPLRQRLRGVSLKQLMLFKTFRFHTLKCHYC